MTTPAWQPGTLYQPGAFVVPRSKPPVETGIIGNANFAAGNTGWTLGSHSSIGAGTPYLPGSSNILTVDGGADTNVNQSQYAVAPGQLINGQCYGWVGTDHSNSMDCRIAFYDNSHSLIEYIAGGTKQGTGNSWQKLIVAAVAPANSAFAAIACAGTSFGSDKVLFSNFTWDYTYNTPADSLTYEAIQANAATSAATEPTWPLSPGGTVVDGGVTWEAVTYSQIVWTATSIMTSGGTEPAWPTQIGGSVVDNTISWEATSRQITDTNCPNTKVVLIGSSHVFAVDDDIIDFCAATNPLDWTTQGDAGFLPTGLQQYGDNPNSAMGLYRGNLVAFNSGGYQMWQIDPDPENMALLDAEPIGCTYPKSVQAVVNDLLFLTPLGIRSVGISGASANLQAGNVGNQIDDLVVAAIAAQPSGEDPIGLYYPARGQYWLIFDNGDGTSTAFVMTVYSVSTAQMTAYNTTSQSWSRYVFPDVITDWTLLGDDLYLRTAGELVWKVDPTVTLDDVASSAGPGTDVALLLPATGTTGSTTFIDVAGNTMTASGAVTVQPNSPFGGGAANFPSNNTPAQITCPITPGSPLDLSTTDFTVEGWVYTPGFGSSISVILDMTDLAGTPLDTAFRIYQSSANTITGQGFGSGTALGDPEGPLGSALLNQWNHFALVRHGTTATMYVNGIGGTPVSPVTGSIGVGGLLSIGATPIISAEQGNFWEGSISDLRITRSAIYTANFIPPTAPFSLTTGIPYTGIIQWPWLDLNSIAVEKSMIGFDAVINGVCSVAIAYDQTNLTAITDGYEINGDTLTGQPIPFPVRGPSLSMQMTFDANQEWEWEASILYIEDDRGFK